MELATGDQILVEICRGTFSTGEQRHFEDFFPDNSRSIPRILGNVYGGVGGLTSYEPFHSGGDADHGRIQEF